MLRTISKKNIFIEFALFIMLFLISAFFTFDARAGLAFTDIKYVDNTQTYTLSGKQESFYLNAGISGSTGTYTEPYSIIYLKRSEFAMPRIQDVSTSSTIKNVRLEFNEAAYWKIRITYNTLTAGPPVANPFRATLLHGIYADGENYHIETKLFSKDGTLLTSSNDQFNVKAYVTGINSQDNGTVTGWGNSGGGTKLLSDDETDASHTHITAGFTDKFQALIQNGIKHTTDTEITYSNFGVDRRKVRTIMKLPSSVEWDPSLPDNADWIYDPVAHTITQDVERNKRVSFFLPFTVKFNSSQNVSGNAWTSVEFPQTNYLINDDGTLDISTERKSKVFKSYKYVPKLTVTKYQIYPGTVESGQYKAKTSGDVYSHLDDNNGIQKFIIDVSQYWGNYTVTGSSVKFKAIADIPNQATEFSGYSFRVWESRFDAANLAKLNHNKLIGVKDDNSEEIIAANINYNPVTTTDEYYNWDIQTSIPTAHYKSVRLEFDDEITISEYGERAVGLMLETKYSDTYKAYVQSKIASGMIVTAYNRGQALSSSGTVMRETIHRNYYRLDFANLRLEKHSQNVNGNPTMSNVQLGDEIYYHINTSYQSFLDNDRIVENAKVIFLADPELIFDHALHHPYQAQNRFTLNTTPEVIYNYKGTGKTAYVFKLENFTEPKSLAGFFYGVDRMYYYFKPTASLTEGEHTVEAFLSWDNNSQNAAGTEPNTVYSHSQTDYLDKYDANNNGSTTDRLSYLTFKFNFVPPRAVILSKKQKLSTETVYQNAIKAETDDIVEYQITAWNNSIDNATDINVMDVFPHAGDKNIVKDEHGNYLSRGSKLYPVLQGPVNGPNTYTLYYSTDAPAATIEGNAAAHWIPESAVTDWSAVTMFKATMNAGDILSPGTTDIFSYSVKIPETRELDVDASANNSVASWYGNNLAGASESIISKVGINKYIVSGKAYYDVDENGFYNAGDIVAANRPVRLVKIEGGIETVVDVMVTDADGNYTFKGKISNAGNYKVYIETLPNDILRPLNNSTAARIGNEFDTVESLPSKMKENQTPVPNVNWAVADVPLTRTDTSKIKNLGLKSIYSNLIVRHLKREDNTDLVGSTTTRQPMGTTYTTAPVTDTYYEVEPTLPLNANGEYAATDTTVTYYYKRKNAGDVTVHHYEYNTTNELVNTVVLPGANKFGLQYTTNEENITNFALTAQPLNKNGNFTILPQTVNYYYKRKNAGNITIKYLESVTNNVLHNQKVLDGSEKLGLPYSENPENITDYELDSANAPANAVGNYTVAPITVTYYYKRKDAGNVVTKYLEENTNAVLASEEIQNGAGKLGLPYTTNAKAITNYQLTANPANATGHFLTTEQTVTYVYRRKDAANVIVKHREQNTNAVLAADETLYGSKKLGLPYTTHAKSAAELPYYELVSGTANVGGTFIERATPVEIVYVYKRKDAGNVTATYIDIDTGEVLSAPEMQSGVGKLGLPYDTDQKFFAFRDLIAVPANKSGNFDIGNILVEYKYRRRDAGNIRVKHLEAGTNIPLAAEEFLDGGRKLGLHYNTAPKTSAELPNYELVGGIPGNANGIYQVGSDIIVTYYYQRENAGNVVSTYKDEATGDMLIPPVVQSGAGKLGLPYDTEAKNFNDYDLAVMPANKQGTFTNINILVEYIYRRKDAGDVTVNHLETGTGDVLYAPTVLDGRRKLGLPYTTHSENIPFYDLLAMPSNSAGIFAATSQNVNYEYVRKNAGDVTVHHISKYDGSELISNEILTGSRKLGLPYITNEANIDNFEIFTVPANATGVFSTSAQDVIYVYKRRDGGEVKAVYVDEDGEQLADAETISGVENAGLPYTTAAKTINHYELTAMPLNANGFIIEIPQTVKYIYRRKNAGNVRVLYIDEDNGQSLLETKILDGNKKLGLQYTSNAETIEFYDLIEQPVNANGVFSEDEQTVIYVYRRKNAGNVTVHYVDPANIRLKDDDILDGSKKLGMPYTTVEAYVDGYHLIRVEGKAEGVFVEGEQEITYVYLKNPSDIIIPGKPVPATPSDIVIPGGRNGDFTVSPDRATNSIATRSNAGSSGSSVGKIKSEKAVKAFDSSEKKLTEPTPQLPNYIAKAEPEYVLRRVTLPVPKTVDTDKIYIYIIMLILSLMALVGVNIRKKRAMNDPGIKQFFNRRLL